MSMDAERIGLFGHLALPAARQRENYFTWALRTAMLASPRFASTLLGLPKRSPRRLTARDVVFQPTIGDSRFDLIVEPRRNSCATWVEVKVDDQPKLSQLRRYRELATRRYRRDRGANGVLLAPLAPSFRLPGGVTFLSWGDVWAAARDVVRSKRGTEALILAEFAHAIEEARMVNEFKGMDRKRADRYAAAMEQLDEEDLLDEMQDQALLALTSLKDRITASSDRGPIGRRLQVERPHWGSEGGRGRRGPVGYWWHWRRRGPGKRPYVGIYWEMPQLEFSVVFGGVGVKLASELASQITRRRAVRTRLSKLGARFRWAKGQADDFDLPVTQRELITVATARPFSFDVYRLLDYQSLRSHLHAPGLISFLEAKLAELVAAVSPLV